MGRLPPPQPADAIAVFVHETVPRSGTVTIAAQAETGDGEAEELDSPGGGRRLTIERVQEILKVGSPCGRRAALRTPVLRCVWSFPNLPPIKNFAFLVKLPKRGSVIPNPIV
jgi:hypothetical protein